MKFELRKPIGYSHIGKKDQQEDAVWPLFEEVSEAQRCFVLCDGVGGSEHGEVASENSSRVIGEYLSSILSEKGVVEEHDIHTAVEKAYDLLDEIDKDGSEERCSMATTLTCVCLNKNGVLAAHMGDSRIYHVRPDTGILYRSADHSLVQALLQSGELTPEEAKDFPRKNVITKAIQPHTHRLKPEVHNLTNIQSGDYLFLCCDGVLENLTDERLVEVLSSEVSDAEKLSLLEAESIGKTRDNFTSYLIPVEKVEGKVECSEEEEDEVNTIISVDHDISTNKPTEHKPAVNSRSIRKSPQKTTNPKNNYWLYLIAIALIVGLIAYFVY